MGKNTIRFTPSIYILLISVICLSSCEKNEVPLSGQDEIIGTWGNQQVNDTIFSFSRTEELAENEYGIIFKRNGLFIERKISGWCGTPPVFYENYTGEWSETGSVISIQVPYWGGMADYKWKIIELTQNKLEVAIISAEFHNAP